MQWEASLTQILELAAPITNLIAERKTLTLENAFHHPDVIALRDKLLDAMKSDGTVESLLAASQQFRMRHAEILAKPELTAIELQQLGVLSAAAQVISSEALVRADSSRALFNYTMAQLVPWLQRAMDLSLVIVSAVVQSRSMGQVGK